MNHRCANTSLMSFDKSADPQVVEATRRVFFSITNALVYPLCESPKRDIMLSRIEGFVLFASIEKPFEARICGTARRPHGPFAHMIRVPWRLAPKKKEDGHFWNSN